MTAKEKAIELVDKMFDVDLGDDEQETSMNYSHAIKCALIAVDEILKFDIKAKSEAQFVIQIRIEEYWQEVKKEIEAL